MLAPEQIPVRLLSEDEKWERDAEYDDVMVIELWRPRTDPPAEQATP